ncbi:YkvA family protein [Pseudalkalibacillus caeni]|uniref:DUF1232 domain-containing protein n=1 Tax=Exobacillus caeni TaxID=2574798 RepID=A0A5R9F382_9BACL|nr:YkvA family protein [Pseudalkalibacillus caeni]TLS38057.1 DUF1232 domain-containing protein [Pseudalkalibacillus caeni]
MPLQNRVMKVFEKMKPTADKMKKDNAKTDQLLKETNLKIRKREPRKGISGVLFEAKSILRLLKAYRTGAYRDISQKSVVMIIAALLYFVIPTDAIPDVLVGFGYIDDAAVIGFVTSQLHKEISKFLEWEQGTNKE